MEKEIIIPQDWIKIIGPENNSGVIGSQINNVYAYIVGGNGTQKEIPVAFFGSVKVFL